MQHKEVPTEDTERSVGPELVTIVTPVVTPPPPPVDRQSRDHCAPVFALPQFSGAQVQCEHFSTVCGFGWTLDATDTDALMDKSVGPLLFTLFWDSDFFDRDFSELRSRGVCAFGGLLDDRPLCAGELSEVTVVRRLSV